MHKGRGVEFTYQRVDIVESQGHADLYNAVLRPSGPGEALFLMFLMML